MTSTRHYVHTVDFARGIAAIGVMVYHLLYGEQIAAYERLAYYCVYAFFVISGFSLYITYRDRLATVADLRRYVVKRFMRIAPLFYLACLLQIALIGWPGRPWSTIPLNLSLAFGFANPGANSMIMGGWSIGIEMVFYLVLPFVIIGLDGSLKALAALTVASIVVMVGFTNSVLAGHATMEGVWSLYTQPLAFFGYFAFGCLVGEIYLRFHHELKGRRVFGIVIVLGLMPFALIQVAAPTDLLKGGVGLMLMGSTMLVVMGSAFVREPQGWTLYLARWLGRLSYSVYLLHPIVYLGLVSPMLSNSTARISATIAVTVALSVLVHQFIEQRFRIGSGLPAAT